jgi:hypothetical protein
MHASGFKHDGLDLTQLVRSATDLEMAAYLTIMKTWGESRQQWGGHLKISIMTRIFPGEYWCLVLRADHVARTYVILHLVGEMRACAPICVVWQGTHYDVLTPLPSKLRELRREVASERVEKH